MLARNDLVYFVLNLVLSIAAEDDAFTAWKTSHNLYSKTMAHACGYHVDMIACHAINLMDTVCQPSSLEKMTLETWESQVFPINENSVLSCLRRLGTVCVLLACKCHNQKDYRLCSLLSFWTNSTAFTQTPTSVFYNDRVHKILTQKLVQMEILVLHMLDWNVQVGVGMDVTNTISDTFKEMYGGSEPPHPTIVDRCIELMLLCIAHNMLSWHEQKKIVQAIIEHVMFGSVQSHADIAPSVQNIESRLLVLGCEKNSVTQHFLCPALNIQQITEASLKEYPNLWHGSCTGSFLKRTYLRSLTFNLPTSEIILPVVYYDMYSRHFGGHRRFGFAPHRKSCINE